MKYWPFQVVELFVKRLTWWMMMGSKKCVIPLLQKKKRKHLLEVRMVKNVEGKDLACEYESAAGKRHHHHHHHHHYHHHHQKHQHHHHRRHHHRHHYHHHDNYHHHTFTAWAKSPIHMSEIIFKLSDTTLAPISFAIGLHWII